MRINVERLTSNRDADVSAILSDFGGDPQRAGVGVLSEWGFRSSDRDQSRRRITRALVEHVPDRRSLAFLVPPSLDSRGEAELVFPRAQIGASNGAVTSIRAHLDLANPTRFHRDLLRGLRISSGASLLDVSRTWQRQFSWYRFSTRESTPDGQSVDPDPELLGRVFENLYQGDERKSTGTYYTPREVVHFMCREALDGYLHDATGVEQSTLSALRQEAVGPRDEHQPLRRPQRPLRRLGVVDQGRPALPSPRGTPPRRPPD